MADGNARPNRGGMARPPEHRRIAVVPHGQSQRTAAAGRELSVCSLHPPAAQPPPHAVSSIPRLPWASSTSTATLFRGQCSPGDRSVRLHGRHSATKHRRAPVARNTDRRPERDSKSDVDIAGGQTHNAAQAGRHTRSMVDPVTRPRVPLGHSVRASLCLPSRGPRPAEGHRCPSRSRWTSGVNRWTNTPSDLPKRYCKVSERETQIGTEHQTGTQPDRPEPWHRAPSGRPRCT